MKAKALADYRTQGLLVMALSMVPLLILLLVWDRLPEVVPVHWGFTGPDRWGSRYELLVVPGMSLLLGIYFSLNLSVEHKLDIVWRHEARIFFWAGVITPLSFGLLMLLLIVPLAVSSSIHPPFPCVALIQSLPGIALIIWSLYPRRVPAKSLSGSPKFLTAMFLLGAAQIIVCGFILG